MTGFFDPLNPLLKSDPYALYKQYLANGSVQRGSPTMPGYENTWYVFGFEEARQLLKSSLHEPLHRVEMSAKETGDIPLSEDRALIWQHLSEWPLFQSPPLHTKRRALLAGAFQEPALKKLEAYLESTADKLLDKALNNNAVNIQQEFSYPLSVTAIAQVLGLPPPDIAWFKGITKKITAVLDLGYVPATYAPGIAALNEIIAYAEDAIKWKRQHLSDDLLSQLLRPIDDVAPLDDGVIVSLITMILITGQETVADGIGNGVNSLIAHPDQLKLARKNPGLIDNVVREILRFDSPLQFTSTRTITRDMHLGDIEIAPGEITIVALGACNRDGRRFHDPDHFDIRRDLSGSELSFGYGIHYCLGVHLARMVMRIAFLALFDKLPKTWALESPVEWRDNVVFRGPTALTLSF